MNSSSIEWDFLNLYGCPLHQLERQFLHSDRSPVFGKQDLCGLAAHGAMGQRHGGQRRVETRGDLDLIVETRNGDVISLSRGEVTEVPGYRFEVTVPSETSIATVRTLVRLTIVRRNVDAGRYNPASLLDAARLKQPLVLRNWQPGDRMRPLHRGSAEKLKRLFQEKKIPQQDRALWPVLLSGDQVVWAKGFGVAAEFAAADTIEVVAVEVKPT